MKRIVWLDRETLVRCWKVAHDRDSIKTKRSDRRVSARPGWEIHWDGLRAEVATAWFLEVPQLLNFSVEIVGDGGTDLVVAGNRIQVKASTYQPPLLRFDIKGSQTFTADVAVLAKVPLAPKEMDATWCDHNGYVELWGWIGREEFLHKAVTKNFGYGDRLVMQPPLRSVYELRS